jgi:hypothetical protein
MAHSETIKRTFALPCGYTATFCWAEQKGFGVEWTPDLPHIIQPASSASSVKPTI